MSEDGNKKGFSQLSSLASDVELTLEELVSRQARLEQPVADHTNQESQTESEEQVPSPLLPPNAEQEIVVSGVSREPDLGSSGEKLYLIFAVAIVLFLLFSFIYFDGEDEVISNSVTSVSEPLQSFSPSPEPEARLLDFEFSEPPVGDERTLSVEQIRWCLREDIWIEVLRPMAMTNLQIDQFNSRIENYNNRCASFRYFERTFIQAQEQVESFRDQIVSIVPIPWDTTTSPAITDSIGADAPDFLSQPDQNPKLTLDIQSALNLLGYDAGPVDGIFGDRTRIAIQDFQRDFGIAIDGRLNESLLLQLEDEAASRLTQTAITTNDSEVPTPTITSADLPASSFTRGSHEDELTQVQGAPTRITRYEYSGYETWSFGLSSVDIDSQTRRVLEWNNYGNLNVTLSPGDQTTSSLMFTINSHADDVLRLQGTPTRITRYEYSGYETWNFGLSSVDIDFQTRRVLEWNNLGNLRVGQ